MFCTQNITHAFYDGASLYDQDQIAIYNKALGDWNPKKHVVVRQYKNTGRPKLPMRMMKAKRLLSMEVYALVLGKI